METILMALFRPIIDGANIPCHGLIPDERDTHIEEIALSDMKKALKRRSSSSSSSSSSIVF